MTTLSRLLLLNVLCLAVIPVLPGALSAAESDPVQDLRDQNQQLRARIDEQQRQIDELRDRLDHLQKPGAPTAPPVSAAGDRETAPASVPALSLEDAGRQIRLSGEAGLALFRSRPNGQFPNSEFRVDDAKLFVEAPVARNAFFFGEIDLTTRETADEYLHVGELYADLAHVFDGGRERNLSIRAGRFYIPFGEEYQVRNVVDNPLITHSVTDLWGVDEGVQLYGQWGPVRYNLAVQNGGHKTLRDYDSDKAVTARLAINPLPGLHLSASAMRTGRLNAAGDAFSEVWLANGFFRALGPSATTTTFGARLGEVDADWSWKTGHLNGAAGWISFDDNNPAGGDRRNLSFYTVEAVQDVADGLFGALRYSGLHAAKGYPLVGLGNFSQYLFAEPPTKDLERLSLGIGYRFAPPLVWKLEYSWEYGRLLNGVSRAGVGDMLSTELAMRF